jgi:hypothetical protein
MLASSCLRSALRLVVGVSRSLATTSPVQTRRRGLHPFTRMSRWSPVVSHFLDGTRPVALVGTRCSYRKRLPLPSAGTEWNVLSSCRAGRPSFTRHISSTRARSSPVRPLLVSRSRDLPSSIGGLFCLCSVLGPMRSLRARCPVARAFSIRSPGLADLPPGLPGSSLPPGPSSSPLGLTARAYLKGHSSLRESQPLVATLSCPGKTNLLAGINAPVWSAERLGFQLQGPQHHRRQSIKERRAAAGCLDQTLTVNTTFRGPLSAANLSSAARF